MKYFHAYKVFIVAFYFIIGLNLAVTAEEPRKLTYRQWKRQLSYDYIKSLRFGVLLVRLHDRQLAIDAFRRSGNEKLAAKIETRIKIKNEGIISAFRECYNFSQVYFFHGAHSDALLNGEYSKVILANDSLSRNFSDIGVTNFFIAGFDQTEGDTLKMQSGQRRDYSDHQIKKVSGYHGKAGMGLSALVIRSEKNVQLLKPFPYKVRTFGKLFFKRNTRKTVIRLNKKLWRHYNKSFG
jgi:hypothetical protein